MLNWVFKDNIGIEIGYEIMPDLRLFLDGEGSFAEFQLLNFLDKEVAEPLRQQFNKNKKFCGTCKQRIDNGNHKQYWQKTKFGRVQFMECPYYVGFGPFGPVVFFPSNEKETGLLDRLKEDLHKREKLLEEQWNR